MSRAGRPELDPIDLGIVQALQADGRRPFTRIARELGVSEAAVRQRVARLEASGTLQIVAVTDPGALGFRIMAMLGISVEPGAAERVAAALELLPEVAYLVLVAGSFDLLVEVVCEDNEHLLRWLDDGLGAIDGIRSTEKFVYLRLVKESYTWSMTGLAPPTDQAG
jgi:Lrp/AsnC family transcriptional regulator, regulator for asnA, asnC and gidA